MTKFYISMTSGIQGPEGELSKEEADKAVELSLQLTEEWPGAPRHGLGALHATNYIVSWENADSPVSSIHVDAYGFTMVWMAEATDWKYYKDTVGLWASLAPAGYATLRKWLDVGEKAIKEEMDKYDEKVLRATD